MSTFKSYKELKLPEPIARNLDKMGFLEPTPVQAETIPAALDGADILGTAQTGTGKTAAFGVPLLTTIYRHPGEQGLILAPTRELAAQILQVLRQMSKQTDILGTLVVGGESFRRQADELYHGVDYIVATPGRLNDHLQEGTVDLSRITILILDEVDRMMDMGFLPQIRAIMRYVPTRRQTLLFSATLPPEIVKLCNSFMKDPVRVAIGPVAEPLAQVKEETVKTSNEGKNVLILKALDERKGHILIFVRTQSRAERLAAMLEKEGFHAVCLHGGRSQAHRKRAIELFRSGKAKIMVATDLAGRGIDVIEIEHVINYDAPGTREDYIHRIGRTGRNGQTGSALNFIVTGDLDGENIVMGTKPPPRVVFRSRRWGRR